MKDKNSLRSLMQDADSLRSRYRIKARFARDTGCRLASLAIQDADSLRSRYRIKARFTRDTG
ncbi:MAG: hypothetical protein M0Q38_15560 [Bacteroidales bacterium]|nr:hypothetical protein [Bacteroidales bacterium]